MSPRRRIGRPCEISVKIDECRTGNVAGDILAITVRLAETPTDVE
jgi:hypothetical protein